MVLMGNVEGKVCIMVDDMIDTGGTACKAAAVLKENGAVEVYMLACHGIFSGNAIEKIMNSEFTKVIITNTLEKKDESIPNDKIDIIDVSWMCAEAMRRFPSPKIKENER